jgi:uncharacterized 2Fe-2S/4Fe-4S cluster protein (DUF4445 family)
VKSYNVDFEPIGKRGECSNDESLLSCARRLGIELLSLCGGLGRFGCCKVQILRGTVSNPTSSEVNNLSKKQLKDGYRLACQTYIKSDCKIRIPNKSLAGKSQRIQLDGPEFSIELEPAVSSYHIRVPHPSLSDLRSDDNRITETLYKNHRVKCESIDYKLLHNVSSLMRSLNWEAQVSVREKEIIAINTRPSRQLGLAIDLGTTTIAGYLVDISEGKTLATKGIINPQVSFGEDIVSRITYAMESASKAIELQKVVLEEINKLIINLCKSTNNRPEQILESVIVGNTVMHHLFLDLPLEYLAVSPFTPVVGKPLNIKAGDIGLNTAPGANINLLPNMAGFVGADHVAMLLATKEIWKNENLSIAIDIGTNTEISLIKNGKISTVSCASGPAFEGAHIKNGMRAAEGAVERLQIINGEIIYETIGKSTPVGICGSGILDAVAQLRLADIISREGRINDNDRVRLYNNQREYVLVEDKIGDAGRTITITQKDVREVQLAKGAIRSGINVLLKNAGCSAEEINKIIIAGAFGSYIDVSSAITIGMLPFISLDRFQQVGNAAGVGAKIALLSNNKRSEAESMASSVSYVELATAPNFEKIFIEATYLE